MPRTYANPEYAYRRAPELDKAGAGHHGVVIVGAGPSGLTAALDLARQGIPSVVLDDNNTVSVGSRAICFAKRTLEILDRLGVVRPMLDKGVTWQVGKVFFRDRQVYEFNLLPERGHRMPAFINLQQYYFEQYMVERAGGFPGLIDLRWKHRVVAVDSTPDRASVSVSTPDGDYRLDCDHLLVADGANSDIRRMLGLDCPGQVFHDRFLIADVVMQADFPTERWFWFDPPFHPGQSVLLHKQPDNVWRIDFQLGRDADPDEERKEENIRPRIQAMLGADVEFELDWASVYTFRCRKMDRFIHQRVYFLGDAAHQVSPFGARGANGGIQGVENLCWKLGRVLRNQAPASLLDSYDIERQQAAAENILNSTRATDFITPKSRASRVFRDAVLELAEHYPFARALVNSGRLSRPCAYADSPLNTADADSFPPAVGPGCTAPDAPIRLHGRPGWLLHLLGDDFTLLLDGAVAPEQAGPLAAALAPLLERHPDLRLVLLAPTRPALEALPRTTLVDDCEALVRNRYHLEAGSAYLLRPDQHVAARWRQVDTGRLENALHRALGLTPEGRGQSRQAGGPACLS